MRPAGVHGYDGDAAELVHISADGVAVIALIHQDVGARPQPRAQQGFVLVEVRDVRPGEDKAQGIAEGVAGQMNLGREARLGAPHRLGELAAGRTSAMGVHAHRRTVDHQVLVVPPRRAQAAQHGLPQAAAAPFAEAAVDGRPGTEVARQIPPRRVRPQDPQDALHSQSQVGTFPTTPLRATQVVPVALNFLRARPSADRPERTLTVG